MQKVKFKKAMKVSPEGATTVEVKAGDVLSVADDTAQALIGAGDAEEHVEEKPAVKGKHGKSSGGAPENK